MMIKDSNLDAAAQDVITKKKRRYLVGINYQAITISADSLKIKFVKYNKT